jgi:hypothetical protein
MTVYETGRIDLAGFVTPFGAALMLGAGAGLAGGLQCGVSIVAGIIVGWIWRRDPGPAIRSAALAAGTLLSVPVALLYDLLLAGLAIGWLVRTSLGSDFLAWERPALVCCFLVPLLSLHIGHATSVLLGPAAPGTLLAICFMRTWRHCQSVVAGTANRAIGSATSPARRS